MTAIGERKKDFFKKSKVHGKKKKKGKVLGLEGVQR